jgi:hypothetical protein
MNNLNRAASSKPLNATLIDPAMPERLASSEPWAQGQAAVGGKRPPSVTVSADSPNKRPRVASPASRWTGAAPANVAPPQFFEPVLNAAAELEPDWSSALFNEPLESFLPDRVLLDSPGADDVDAFAVDAAPLELLSALSDSPKNGIDEATHQATHKAAACTIKKGIPDLSDLKLQSHRELIIELHAREQKTSSTPVFRFLVYLEQLGLDWNTLRGDMNNLRPISLETHVNTAIRDKKVPRESRATLNKFYGLRLHGQTAVRPTWKPTWRAHLDLIESKKPLMPSQRERTKMSVLSGLLGYLEFKNISWDEISQPEPHEHSKRPIALEIFINTGISNGEIDIRAIGDINKMFNLILKAPSYGLYKLPEHTNLMESSPDDLSKKYKQSIVVFLAHLEDLKTCWSEVTQVRAGESGKSTLRLEKIIDTAIHSGLVSSNIRESLNLAFGLKLKGQSFYDIPEHAQLLERVPKKLENGGPNKYYLCISNFLTRLERQGARWSVVCAPSPGDDPLRPMRLEALVAQEIAAGASASTRAALNYELGLQLRGPAGGVTVSRSRAPKT